MKRKTVMLQRTLYLLLLLIVTTFNINKVVYSYDLPYDHRVILEDNPKILLDVPLISQLPELKNGCEITCLTMLLNYLGSEIDKLTLAEEMPKDDVPLIKNVNEEIVFWGNPKVGFVGDVTGKKNLGYSIYPEGLESLLDEYTEGNAVVLNGEDYFSLEKHLMEEKPVLVWVTSDFKAPRRYATWDSTNETIHAYFSQHCVVVTGFSEDFVYYNDPLKLGKNKKVPKSTFISVYNAMGKMALTYE